LENGFCFGVDKIAEKAECVNLEIRKNILFGRGKMEKFEKIGFGLAMVFAVSSASVLILYGFCSELVLG
jgi:hypothetical protein